MKAATIPIVIAVAAMACSGGCNPARGTQIGGSGAAVLAQSISLDDIAPTGLALKQCWNAMGMDSRERVYIGATSRRLDGREDFALFRYDPATGAPRFLGPFMRA